MAGWMLIDSKRFSIHWLSNCSAQNCLSARVGRRTCQARVPAVEGHERHGAVEDHERRAQRRNRVAPAPRDEVHRVQSAGRASFTHTTPRTPTCT